MRFNQSTMSTHAASVDDVAAVDDDDDDCDEWRGCLMVNKRANKLMTNKRGDDVTAFWVMDLTKFQGCLVLLRLVSFHSVSFSFLRHQPSAPAVLYTMVVRFAVFRN